MGANGTARRRRRGGDSRQKYPTRGTSRPEGGQRSAGGDAPAPIRQWPFLVVLGTVLTGLLITLGDFRIGLLVVGGGLLAGAPLRAWLPAVGMLAVRSRFTDVVTYAVLGAAIVLLTLMAEPKPWLEVPFLNDVLRFSSD
ncbi:DUF3017 domain-containing protein [Streptomyces litchfieldiae]|uniref:DUF3017 domain-containing protein n=1 Tax=Streptomyces litchfieldiae TaxID=3075543 RepID=A0ABU2N030_9ACTN|nr:DUF3017 domain-containing protein [Streptomyces sp. DSM 44938]MDT0347256.1 DUF3017 domain-containing protein [Streptomyces sp. DSM 44938]